jgi:hypothetical protein
MLRVTPAQLSLLEANLARAGGQASACTPRGPRRREHLPENVLEAQIRDFLVWRGYVSIRQHVGTFVPFRVLKQLQCGQLAPEMASHNIVQIGEEGMTDWLSLRPMIEPGGRALDGPWPWAAFFWECKAPNKRPSPAQLEWIDRRRQCGFETVWFNQFAATGRPSSECEPRESHVFETWFLGYFTRCHQ